MDFKIGNRKELVFQKLVREYVYSAHPVGSKVLAEEMEMKLSPATIRNYFKEFEKLGLVSQPHASAGRVPTDLGFRYYVNHLSEPEIFNEDRIQSIRNLYGKSGTDLESFTRQTPKILSQLSHQIGILVGPRMEESRLREIHFLRLDAGRILAIYIFSDEIVENQILKNQESLTSHDLHRLSAYLNKVGQGKTLAGLRAFLNSELKAQGRNQNQEMRKLFCLSEELIQGKMQAGAGVSIEGQSNLANSPEFNKREKLEEVLRLLEDQRILLALLDQSLKKRGVRVIIGKENAYPQMSELTMIAADYVGRDGRPVGSIGIIGPKRMDYEKGISLVSYIARMISELLRIP